MSDNKEMSSPYVVLENRSLDEWKVTELKDELKKRNLITKGLKDDLVKRLDEAIRAEMAEAKEDHENGVDNETNKPEIPSDDTTIDPPAVAEKNIDKNESVKKDKMTENLEKELVLEGSVETSTGMVNEVNLQQEDTESKPEVKVKPNSSEIVSQVDDSKVKSDTCILNETIPITEKNENVITDDVKLEHDVKPSYSGKTESVIDDELAREDKGKDVKTNDSVEAESAEKLNLDRSSADDSMEEDALESKQTDPKFVPQNDKIELPVAVMVEDPPVNKNTETTKDTKRKLRDEDTVTNSEVVKRQRKTYKTANSSVSTTPKERVVPPSSKPATTSLRIDRFLRPFTLKAVQDLLGKTGTVVSFWMDHIKTHCYVTYSSVEEAVETRNAVYNLQWPTNGGRLLVAEFVDPLEVKSRIEAPPVAPGGITAPILPQPPPSTRQPPPLTTRQPPPPLTARQPPQQLPPPPPLPLPPPPPLTLPLPPPVTLPPPPPLPENFKPKVITLDDLFRKTRSSPRIYYLPLTDEQVAEKLKNQESGKQ